MIPLQTTRKENNWKTAETLTRTVVTLETERIKLVQSLMFMMMMMMTNKTDVKFLNSLFRHLVLNLIEVIAVVLEVKVWIYFLSCNHFRNSM